MDEKTLTILLGTAVFLGVFHTLTGPDHYIPFIAMARVGRWSLARTSLITLACGIGHVLSSVVLGLVGIALGTAVGKLEWFEGLRGDLAGWLLLGFGLAYTIWGIRRAIRNRPHTHWHGHADGSVHMHEHAHHDGHVHAHGNAERSAQSLTPWILFTIFVFGPCEPLIPLLMYPAAELNWWGVVLVTLAFGIATIGTMMVVVTTVYLGLTRVSVAPLQRYAHALAGLAITACGLAVKLGL